MSLNGYGLSRLVQGRLAQGRLVGRVDRGVMVPLGGCSPIGWVTLGVILAGFLSSPVRAQVLEAGTVTADGTGASVTFSGTFTYPVVVATVQPITAAMVMSSPVVVLDHTVAALVALAVVSEEVVAAAVVVLVVAAVALAAAVHQEDGSEIIYK